MRYASENFNHFYSEMRYASENFNNFYSEMGYASVFYFSVSVLDPFLRWDTSGDFNIWMNNEENKRAREFHNIVNIVFDPSHRTHFLNT